MLLKTERAKGGDRIYGKDLLRRAIGKKRDRNGDQPAHEVRVAVATVVQDPPAFRVRRWLAFQPNLADAAPNFVEVVVGLRAQRLERMTQFEDVTISILPVVERCKIVAYTINRRQGMRQPHCVVHRPYMGARQRPTSAKCLGNAGRKLSIPWSLRHYSSDEPRQ